MPISSKNLGKYKIPGIYIEEVNDSIVEKPIQDVLINLVPGFSRKGPVNKPIYVDTKQKFEEIFGPVDKYLENKGSYFHRTIETMLSRGSVWALNLLNTDPQLDQLEWKSISLSSSILNGNKIKSPYERFFNRQDFWERDEESFNDIVVENNSGNDDINKILHLTNMSNRTITVFMFKSNLTGFDITVETWYKGKYPLFLYPKDYISDYMVGILIVHGDWSNYDVLSNDPIWSEYFTTNGLIKEKIGDFANHQLITRLAYYDVSLIPNFKDLNDKDMYIRNIINNDTDKTGLFCTYNENALLEYDYPIGNVDLIGHTLIGNNISTIDFMSYNTPVSEKLIFSKKDLNSVNNVFGNYSDMTTSWVSGRTANYTNWYTSNIKYNTATSVFTTVTSTNNDTITLSATTNLLVDDIIYFSKGFSVIDKSTPYYITSISGNNIKISTEKNGNNIGGIVLGSTITHVYTNKLEFTGVNAFYNIGGYQYTFNGDITYLNPLTINNSSSTYSRYDILYLSNGNKINILSGNQANGNTPSYPNYILNNESTIILGYVKTIYNNGVLSMNYNSITVDSSGYVTLNDLLFKTGNTYLEIEFLNTSGSSNDWTNYNKLRNLKVYNEISSYLLNKKGVIINYTNGYKYQIETLNINDPTITTNASIRIIMEGENPNNYFNNKEFIIYYVDDEFDIQNGSNTITTTNKPNSSIVAKYSSFYLSYFNGMINNNDYIYKYNDQTSNDIYNLEMRIDDNDILTIRFKQGSSYMSIDNFDVNYNNNLEIYSGKENLTQTIEIEKTNLITDPTNTTLIYVKKDRYSEIIKGTYLEAYYTTPNNPLTPSEMPRKMVRIVDIKNDTNDTTLKILKTDGPIKINTIYSGSTIVDYYTTSYMTIDNYISEYKGIALEPFVIRKESYPNGTEERQNVILDVISKNTKIFKGLTNKNRISWRYLIDSFGLGLIANSKQQLVDICGYKLNSLGFINMPSARQFKKSINPSFINDDYSINMEYIKEGANPLKNPDFYYSFGEGVGQSCVSYWFPYIKTDDESQKFIPPAAEIAKTYMNKYLSIDSTIKPWTILGGIYKGNLTNVKKTEIRFNNDDLIPLHDMGANPIEYIDNYGYIINSDNTAQIYPYSSLSLIHSREVLIELENRLYDMLLNYHWRFNTPEIRSEIKYRADQICKEIKDNDGLYDFRNVCDKTNNTDHIIDLQMGVLDTYVEIVKGMGIIVNQITILKKGTIESSGFNI